MLHIVTVATKNEGYFDFLHQSCKRNGGKLEVLGWGEKWQGHSQKLKLMHIYLQNLHDNDIVCFVDGYDVIILQPVQTIESIFKKSGKNIIVSRDIETENIPILSTFGNMYFGKCKNYPINSGTYMGYVKYLKILLNDILTNYDLEVHKDDQILFTKICNKYDEVAIDIDRKLFLVTCHLDNNVNKITFENKQLKFRDAYPCILHAPSNYDLNHILQEIGYDVRNNKQRNSIYYLLNSTIFFNVCKIIICIFFTLTILYIIIQMYHRRAI
jgi:hypothetical protein